jgi:tRNA pseudouridine55 synthase
MYSAIKQNGQPLYKLARQGVEVERKTREIQIKAIELLSFVPPLAAVRVTCSRGTYIRTLADDIGRELGCGAALQELRRTASGPFRIEDAITLAELEVAVGEGRAASLCRSSMMVLDHLPDIPLNAEGMDGLRFGRAPAWSNTQVTEPLDCAAEILVRLTYGGSFVAVARLIPCCGADSAIVLKRVLI